eukprot:m.308082 g.308082  ORF g.308082 m.308082 type:complete len:499 (+) comp43352_c0_seq1:665-2161(+)
MRNANVISPGTMPSFSYNVPVILPDLRREESLCQIADTLEYLEHVANDVFNKISARVAEHRDRLASVNNRVNVAQARIQKVKGSTKATQVFSCAKYPAPDRMEPPKAIYSHKDVELADIRRCTRRYSSRPLTVDARVMRDKQNFHSFPVDVDRLCEERRAEEAARASPLEDDEGEGLGRLPKVIPSVSSLLLFNTSENPYKKYVILDPLAGVSTKTRKVVEEEGLRIGDAPTTIAQREQMARMAKESYFYMPEIGEVPSIDLPLDLPDLPGIAGDLAYSADLGPSIAPSVPGSNMPDLPTVEGVSDPAAVSHPPSVASSAEPASSAPPPPPPSSVAGPPPPPPPPPPTAPSALPSLPPVGESEPDDEAPPSGGGGEGDGGDRGDLLAAIRGDNKSRLKSAKNRKIKKREKKEEASGGGGGDLMSDLMAKLTLRRKGISGSKKGGEKKEESEIISPPTARHSGNLSSNPTLEKVSSMIPVSATDGGDDASDVEAEWEDD